MLDKITNDQRQVIWIDLRDPTPSEINQVEKEFNLHIPSRHELGEIESSSRLQFVNDFIKANLPSLSQVIAEEWPAPVGFILNAKILITIRFQDLPSFAAAKQVFHQDHKGDSADAFAHILEQMVETAADILEKTSHDTTNASHDIFRRYSRACVIT